MYFYVASASPHTKLLPFLFTHVRYQVYREYQRQLWDPESLKAAVITKADAEEFHFHRFGSVGVLFVDMRGSKIRMDGEKLPRNNILSNNQRQFITRSLETRDMKALIVVSEFPIISDKAVRTRQFAAVNPVGYEQVQTRFVIFRMSES